MIETSECTTDDQEEIIMEESSSSVSSTASSTSSSRDLSAPYFDDGNLVPIKTSMQFYWDCPQPSSPNMMSTTNNSKNQSKQRLFLPVGTHLLPKRLTARIIPGVGSHNKQSSSAHVEYEPLKSS